MRVSVVGSTGYAGGELLRLLIRHAEVELVHLAAGEREGATVESVWPGLRDLLPGRFSALEPRRIGADSDLVFTALPARLSPEVVPALLEEGARVVDVGPDFRLPDAGLYRRWYGRTHAAPDLLREAVYGLTEWEADAVAAARLVANPGCYPTAAALALLPLAREGLLGERVIVDAKSGVSGAGRSPSRRTTYAEVSGNLRPYGVMEHRHTPEIEHALAGAGQLPEICFVPHVVPMTRGILATCYADLTETVSQEDALDLHEVSYAAAPFVRVSEALPETKATAGTNFCDVTVRMDDRGRTAVAVAAIDNLGKGAAGQAVQNMNLMFGLEETEGLWNAPLYP
jgi:N-acetyl-gamma-glutamyl-phosphate reductase